MKNSSLIVSTLLLTLPFALAHAKANAPCKNIYTACESAGYIKGKGVEASKRLVPNCFLPILEGKTVEKVTVAERDIPDCIAARKKAQDKRKAKEAEKADASESKAH